MNPTLVPFARGDSNIKITAMIGIGLMAMPTANGRISPITEPTGAIVVELLVLAQRIGL
jgi:hypothetical protein